MRGQGRGQGQLVAKLLTRWLHANTAAGTAGAAAAAPAAAAILTRAQVAGQRKRALFWGLGVGVGLGTLAAGGLAYQESRKKPAAVMNHEEENSFLLAKVPPFQPSRTVKFAAGSSASDLKLTLYQYQTCPFCCKVRTMLDFYGIPYNVVEVNPVLRTQLKWSEKYRKVPILIVETPEGEVLQLKDSSMIVSVIYSYLAAKTGGGSGSHDNNGIHVNNNAKIANPDRKADPIDNSSAHEIAKFYPSIKYTDDKGAEQTDIMNKYFLMLGSSETRAQKEIIAERQWRTWVDSVYVHTLSPNIYRTLSEALDSFRYFDKVGEWDKNFSPWERTLVIYVGALAMWMVGKRLQKRHHLHDDVRQSLYQESDRWLANVKKSPGEFMGGATPNLADLAVFGVLSSIEGCEAFRDLSQNSDIVSEWFYKVKKTLQHPVPGLGPAPVAMET